MKPKILLLASVMAAGTPFAVNADEMLEGLAHCRDQTSDSTKLSCYLKLTNGHIEKVTGYKPEATPVAMKADGEKPEPDSIGKWDVSEQQNELDDSRTVLAHLVADSGAGRFGARVTLTARCKSNNTDLIIGWGGYLGNDGDIYNNWKRVTIRLGDRKAKTQRWPVSTSNDSTFAPSWSGSLLLEMSKENRFVARVTPYGENPVTAVFDTTGMKAALSKLATTCGWYDKLAAASG